MRPETIEKYNTVILQKMSCFLNQHADFIEESIINELVQECGLSCEEAFTAVLAQACGLDIVTSDQDMELYELYFVEMVKKLDIEYYEQDPYYQHIQIPKVRQRKWLFKDECYKPYEAFVYDDLKEMSDGRVIPQIGFFEKAFTYPAVFQNNREWMLITPNEMETMKEAVTAARGKVLTFGLGLGYFAYRASEKEAVNSVTVVEKDQEVIDLFKTYILPQFPHSEKIHIIHEDAFVYAGERMAGEKFDFIFTDIWHDPSDGIALYLKMKQYEKFNPDSQFMYWIEKTMQYYL